MRARACAAVALLGLLSAPSLFAQEATLTDRVVDSSGGVVPGASVVLTNSGTAVTTETVTNDRGLFIFASARPGS
jgi:hypothetical protein